MKTKITLLALLFSAGVSTSAHDFSSTALSLAKGSPDVAAARARVDAIEADDSAENTLEGLEIEGDYKFGPDGNNRWGMSVGQSFDWPGVYHARNKANAFRSEAYRQLYRQNLREQWLEIADAMVRCWHANELVSTLNIAADNLRQLDEIYRRQLSRGEATILDTKKIALELASINSRAAQAHADAVAANALMQSYATAAGITLPESYSLPVMPLQSRDTYESALLRDPEYAALRSLGNAAAADVTVAKRKGMPAFRISYIHDFEEDTHFNGVGLSISLPTWRPKLAVNAARAHAAEAERAIESYSLRSSAQLAADYATAAALSERLNASAALYDMADYPALLRKALDAGKMTLLDYLTEYNFYLDAMAEFNSLRADCAAAQLRLDQYLIADEINY